MTAAVRVKGGSLYLGRDVCERYFAGLEAVILLQRDGDLLILPVRNAAAGGYLLKVRNAAGDRVVQAADFFRAQGVADDRELRLEAVWSSDQGGLVAASALVM